MMSNDLPSNWQRRTLGDVGKIITGKTPSTKVSEHFNGDVPFVTPSDMDNRKMIETTERYFIEKHSHLGGFDGRFRLTPQTIFDFQRRMQNWASDVLLTFDLRRQTFFTVRWGGGYERLFEEEFERLFGEEVGSRRGLSPIIIPSARATRPTSPSPPRPSRPRSIQPASRPPTPGALLTLIREPGRATRA